MNLKRIGICGWKETIPLRIRCMTAERRVCSSWNMKEPVLYHWPVKCTIVMKTNSVQKGINKKQNEITKQKYVDALKGNSTQEFVNNGFRVKNNQMNTYSLTKTGMKLLNDNGFRIGFQTFSTKL
ncbi:hypothetical protein QVD99_007929 [Batrachochytrium dendrobatidis]|nr:hypothetical protein QVD99_007929 [Batrachochytrium dendrobatidis]